jgi:hypothetical protein
MLQILQHWAAPHEIHSWLDLRARLSQAETKAELVVSPRSFWRRMFHERNANGCGSNLTSSVPLAALPYRVVGMAESRCGVEIRFIYFVKVPPLQERQSVTFV